MRLFNDLYGQRVQALVNEILQCIIHKPVTRHAALTCKEGAGNTHPKVGAKAGCVGARVASVVCAFVKYLQVCRGESAVELLLKRLHVYGRRGAHGVVPGLMCLFR